MTRVLAVSMEGRPAGEITREAGGRLRLRYAERYAGTPLSVSMPVEIGTHSDALIRPWLEGLLPDNEAVLARWAREFRVGTSALALLGSPVGEECAGAVQFTSPERAATGRPGTVGLRRLHEREIAARLRALKRDQSSWLGEGDSGRFSLAGAQGKFALHRDEGGWGIPDGALPTTHILKPAIPGHADHEINEHLCLAAARRLGLLAARSEVAEFEDQRAIVVERYDRATVGGHLLRIHQEDLCQALSVPPSGKYEADGGPGARSIIDLIARVMSPPDARVSIHRFTDALILNWFIAGTDAHAKNYGLLLRGGDVKMAPLYDLASALPYREHESRLKLAMKLGRDYGAWPRHDPWPYAARSCGLGADALRARVLDLGGRIPDALSDAAADPAIRRLGSPLPAVLVGRVADRVRRCLAVMGA